MNPIIRLEAIQKTYKPGLFRKPIPALRELSVTVRPGEVYAIVGPNGAGKTTGFRILFGLVRPDAGSGSLLDRPLGHPDALRRLGYLPEAPCYYPYLTVRELLLLAARLSGERAPRGSVGEALERFDLEGLADRPLRRLSKGQLQRVGLAQASVHRPDLFILDEPMSGLDPLRRAQVKAWIRAMRREGRTVLLASHVLADVEALADRVGILLEGRIVRETTAEELLEGEEQGTEVEFTTPADPRELLAEIPANLEERAGIWAASFTAGSEMAVHALIARVLSHGGAIRSVLRNRRSLETLYVDSMRDHAAPAARKEARR